ncbi:uncharacterized protein CBL_00265 [Carabus blaptoides fortunei]
MHDYMNKTGDPRTANFPLMSSPVPTMAICLSYVYFVKVLGPKIMENRKPMQFKNTLIIYNLFQVIFSAWLFYEIGMSGWFTGFYSYRCQPVDHSNHPSTMRMVHACWWYYFSKFTEFFDTIFFVLRKKNDHVSTLHVIHHGCMPMSVWFGVKFTPVNTGLIILQVQFILIMVHAFQLLFIECDYPRAFVWWIGMHAVMFFFLFNEFYKQAYHKKQRARAKLANGIATKANGAIAQKDAQTPVKNGSAKVSDYYINGELTAGLHHRTTEVK